MNDSIQKDTLFLHGGPGFHAYVEREVLSGRLPNVHFWDQPPIHTSRDAFNLLVDAVVAEVHRMAADLGGPVKLMANSFGALIVSGLLKRIPHRISDCHIFGPTYDIPEAFLRLLEVAANDTGTESALVERLRLFLGQRGDRPATKSEVWDYLRLVSVDADYLRHYWPTRRQYDTWCNYIKSTPAFDFITVQNVVNDFLEYHDDRAFVYSGTQDITIELGGKDPLLIIDRDASFWARRFPDANVIVHRESGHFIHLEPYF